MRIKLPNLEKNSVIVFTLKDRSEINSELMTYYFDCITKEEQNKYHKFKFDKDKRLFLLSHAMLRICLSEYLNCNPVSIEFDHNAYGKPFLKKHPLLKFNLSHSKKVAALALNFGNNLSLGIDVENKKRGNISDLATNYFSTAENQLLNAYPKHMYHDVFFKLWTLKESYIKAIGKGLSIELDGFSFQDIENNIKVNHYAREEAQKHWMFKQFESYQDYILALAIRAEDNCLKALKINRYDYCPELFCSQIYPD